MGPGRRRGGAGVFRRRRGHHPGQLPGGDARRPPRARRTVRRLRSGVPAPGRGPARGGPARRRRLEIAPPQVTEPMGGGHASDGLDADGAPVGSATAATSTTRRPLGDLLGARSGDKGGGANIGLWADDDETYRWMRDTLTVDALRAL